MSEHPVYSRPYQHLLRPRDAHTQRASSWDRSGGNADFVRIEPGATHTLLEVSGPGCITHLYAALPAPAASEYRDAVLRCYWDGADEPSVAVPLGDFFGISHGRVRAFASAMLAVNDGLGVSHGLNSYFPMPFVQGARITIENRTERVLGGAIGALWYQVDYELYSRAPEDDPLRFHAAFRLERPTIAEGDRVNIALHDGLNLSGEGNFVALDTRGEGSLVGIHLEIENHHGPEWYGEGDDYVFIDDEPYPPRLHGTGHEEAFGAGACVSREFVGPYSGYHLVESEEYDGCVGMYRWYLADPVQFSTALRWTIEHGHANNFANTYAAVAYWYQNPTVGVAIGSRDELALELDDEHDRAFALVSEVMLAARAQREEGGPDNFFAAGRAARPYSSGDWAGAVAAMTEFRERHGL